MRYLIELKMVYNNGFGLVTKQTLRQENKNVGTQQKRNIQQQLSEQSTANARDKTHERSRMNQESFDKFVTFFANTYIHIHIYIRYIIFLTY